MHLIYNCLYNNTLMIHTYTLYISPALYIHPTRILSRVQAVFYRQTINWMVYGHCPSDNTLTTVNTNNNTYNNNSNSTYNNSNSPHHQPTTNLFFIQPVSNLDRENPLASTSFTLLLDRIPTSHVSPKLASRILFAGKTAYLLQHNNNNNTTPNTNSNNSNMYTYDKELFRYFTSSEHHQHQHHLIKEGEKEEEAQGELEMPYTTTNSYNKENINLTHKQPFTTPTTTSTAVNDRINALNQLKSGLIPPYFGLDIINKYAIQMHNLLSTTPEKSVTPENLVTPEKSVLLFETLVDDIYMYISNVLWRVLVDKYSVYEHFHMIRNIYLLGQ